MARDDRPRRSNRLRQRARQDVRFANRPVVSQLDRAEQGIGAAYGGLDETLWEGRNWFDQQAKDIRGDFISDVSGLPVAEMAGFNMPDPEIGAAREALNALNFGSLERLASQRGRASDLQASAVRESDLARRYALDNVMQQRQQIAEQMPQDILSRMNELRDAALERQLAKSAMEADEASAAALAQYLGAEIRGDLSQNPRRGRRPRRGPRRPGDYRPRRGQDRPRGVTK